MCGSFQELWLPSGRLQTAPGEEKALGVSCLRSPLSKPGLASATSTYNPGNCRGRGQIDARPQRALLQGTACLPTPRLSPESPSHRDGTSSLGQARLRSAACCILLSAPSPALPQSQSRDDPEKTTVSQKFQSWIQNSSSSRVGCLEFSLSSVHHTVFSLYRQVEFVLLSIT